MKKKFNFFFLLLIIFLLRFQDTHAELLKPSKELKAFDVIKIQLAALKNNNIPVKNYGIKQTWEFSHPLNKRSTGPLSRFIQLLNGEGYNYLLNHIDHKIVELFKSDKKYIYEVTILNKEKFFFKYQWQIEKFIYKGPLNNCWLTTSVSLPVSLGSSI